MITSEQINEISAALAKAQGEMEVAPKDSINPHFKSSYANLAACVRAARPALSKHGLCVIQSIELNDSAKMIGVLTRLSHASGQFFESATWCQPRSLAPQDIGSCATYLKRYGFSAMVGLITEEDDDGEAASGRTSQQKTVTPTWQPPQQKPVAAPPPAAAPKAMPAQSQPSAPEQSRPAYPINNSKPVTDPQMRRLHSLKNAAGWHDQEIKQYIEANYNVTSAKALTQAQYKAFTDILEQGVPFSEAFAKFDVPHPAESDGPGGAYDPTLDEIPF
jgi:hypothetical protein